MYSYVNRYDSDACAERNDNDRRHCHVNILLALFACIVDGQLKGQYILHALATCRFNRLAGKNVCVRP